MNIIVVNLLFTVCTNCKYSHLNSSNTIIRHLSKYKKILLTRHYRPLLQRSQAARLRRQSVVRIEVLIATRHARAQPPHIAIRVYALHVHRVAARQSARLAHQPRLRKQPPGRIQSKDAPQTAAQLGAAQTGNLRTKTMSDQRDPLRGDAHRGDVPQELRQPLGDDARAGRRIAVLVLRQGAPVQCAEVAADMPLVAGGGAIEPAPVERVEPAVYEDGQRCAEVERAGDAPPAVAGRHHDELGIDAVCECVCVWFLFVVVVCVRAVAMIEIG